MSNNPLIDYPELPPFSKIQPEHVLPAVEQLVADGRARIQQVLAEGKFDYAHLVQALDEEDDRLGKAFGPAGHLNAVAQNEALRNAYNSCLPLLSEYGTEVGQNAQLCAAYQALRDSDEWSSLSEAQQKDIENTLRDFRLSGVDLPDDKKAQYMANSKRLSELTSQFFTIPWMPPRPGPNTLAMRRSWMACPTVPKPVPPTGQRRTERTAGC